MEFTVNESGCRQLSMDMLNNLRDLATVIRELSDKDAVLHTALGDDYESIAHLTKIMTSELAQGQSELNTVINDMDEYMSRVQQVRVSLNNGN